MMQHEPAGDVRVLQEEYELDTLGAPFKVVLLDSVSVSIDPQTGDEKVEIPDVVGLINAVVRRRVLHPRKLSGAEIKFIRNALGVRAKPLAKFLDMSPEHFSRCEAGAKVMSGANEKVFRMFAFSGTFFKEASDIFNQRDALEDVSKLQENGKKKKLAGELVQMFLTLKIQSVFDAKEGLRFEFVRKVHEPQEPEHEGGDDDEWKEPIPLKIAVGM
jgi:DNA-binding transcriptional regulator YiaG